MEISDTEQTVLALLGDVEAYGLDLIERARAKRGLITYADLERMVARLLLASRMEDPAPTIKLPRRLYRATAAGKQALNASRCPECRASWPYRPHRKDCSRL